MGKDIRREANYYIRKFNTNNPFDIAEYLNIKLFMVPLGNGVSGYYKYMKKNRCIFIDPDIENETYKKIVMAHELGHAILHKTENCYFINHKTLLLSSKIEKEANIFAAELLIKDSLINDYEGFTIKQIADCTGITEELLKLKYNHK